MTNRSITSLLLTILVLAIAGTSIWDFAFKAEHDTILGITVFAIAAVTFFGFLMTGRSTGSRRTLDKGGMRTAITAAFIVTYLFMLAFITFLVGPKELTEGKKAYIDSFTTVISITIAFYFGGSFAVQALQALGKDEKASEESSENEEKDP